MSTSTAMTQSPWSSLTSEALGTSCPASRRSIWSGSGSWWTWVPIDLNLLVPTILLATTFYTSSRARAYYRAFQQSKAKNAALTKRLDELKRSLGDSDAEVRALNVRVQQTDEERRVQASSLEERLSKASEELLRVQKQNEELIDSRTQLERQFEELQVQAQAQAAASAPTVEEDQVTESDAIQLLNDLNNDISNVGTGLAEEGTKVVKEVEEALRDALLRAQAEEEELERDNGAHKHPSLLRPQRFFPDRKLSDSPGSLHDVVELPPPPQNMYTYPYSNPQQPMGIPFPTAPPSSTSRSAGQSGSSISSSSSEGRSQQGPYERQVAERREKEQREAEEAENSRMKEELQEARAQAIEVFGEGLVGLLQAAGPASTSTARPVSSKKEKGKEREKRDSANGSSMMRTFELAFRTALSAYTHWMMCSWFFDDDRQEGNDGLDLEGMLSEVYARVREGEEQAVSGQWRSVTRKHVQRMFKRPQSRSSTAPSSKRNSNEEPSSTGAPPTRRKEPKIAIEEGSSVVEEPEEISDPLLEELCVYVIDALVNVLIVSGVHGGCYIDDGEPSSSEDDEEEDQGLESEQEILGEDADMGDYVDVYHDPYKGYSISQLSEFLAVTPTAQTFKIGPIPPPGLTSTTGPSNAQIFEQREARRKERSQRRALEKRVAKERREVTKKYNHTHLHAHLTAVFKPNLLRILRKAKGLNKVLGEGVVWCDLEALYVAPGVGFEEATMEAESRRGSQDVESRSEERGMHEGAGVVEEDDDDDEGERTPRTGGSPNAKQGPSPPYKRPNRQPEKRKERLILCTTHLGLVRAEKVPKTRGEWKEEVLVKPRVVLLKDY